MFKRFLSAVLTAVPALMFVICLQFNAQAAEKSQFSKDDEWLVYLYICGTDLEENAHLATRDIAGIERVKLPPNVKILIDAGGAKVWHHPVIKEGGEGIYLYSSNHLEKQADFSANIGKASTLEQFLQYGEKNFNPDHRILIFWNHGGVNGLCYDKSKSEEMTNLTYDDLTKVLSSVYGNSSDNPPFELIGFDACMTASYELATSISDFSRYMVGSEPSENGWYFKDWVKRLADNPAVDGKKLGKVICDSTMWSYEKLGRAKAEINAFSVIDLSKVPELKEATEEYFNEAVRRASESTGFKGAFARAAESRGVDRFSDVYTDLGLLAKSTKSILPEESGKLLNAINKAVVHNKRGSYLRAKGIATYYPYVMYGEEGISSAINSFAKQSTTPVAQKQIYSEVLKLNVDPLTNMELDFDSKKNVVVKLDPEQLENVSNVDLVLLPVVENGEIDFGLNGTGAAIMISDKDVKIDWKKGTVTENFHAFQPKFDGHVINLIPTGKGRGHNFYEVPILLTASVYNNTPRRCKLVVHYDVSTKKYSIIGLGDSVENGMVRSNYYKLRPGDVITPLFAVVVPEESIGELKKVTDKNGKTLGFVDSEDGNEVILINDPKSGKTIFVKRTSGESFVYTEDSKITDEKINRGTYLALFRFIAPNGTATGSWPFALNVKYGEIEKYIPDEDDIEEAQN